jgi:hypothetical protein
VPVIAAYAPLNWKPPDDLEPPPRGSRDLHATACRQAAVLGPSTCAVREDEAAVGAWPPRPSMTWRASPDAPRCARPMMHHSHGPQIALESGYYLASVRCSSLACTGIACTRVRAPVPPRCSAPRNGPLKRGSSSVQGSQTYLNGKILDCTDGLAAVAVEQQRLPGRAEADIPCSGRNSVLWEEGTG